MSNFYFKPDKSSDYDVQIDATTAMSQAGMTSDDYLAKSYKILKDKYKDWTMRDAIELAKIMAQDFHTTMICMKMQEIRDALHHLGDESGSSD